MARDLGVPHTDKQPFYFISYNSEDEKRVSEYAKAMSRLGLPMWYDNGIKVGEEWQLQIAEKIENCQAVIMFLSKNIFMKEESYVHKEFELATEYSCKNVYIMMLDNIKKPEVPVRFRTWWTNVTKLQCINAFEYSTPDECVKKLAESCGFKSADAKKTNEDNEQVERERQEYTEKKSGTKNKTDGAKKRYESFRLKIFTTSADWIKKGYNTINSSLNIETTGNAKYVYLSISSGDLSNPEFAKKVEMLCTALEKRDIQVWMPEKNIRPGEDYNYVVPKAIKNCSLFLAFLTYMYTKSSERKAEIMVAKEHRKNIIPILTQKLELEVVWNYIIKSYQAWDLFSADETRINELADYIEVMIK